MKKILLTALLLFSGGIIVSAQAPSASPPDEIGGAASYTPFDVHAMFWSRGSTLNKMVWTASGAESGRLLVSQAPQARRPDFALCTQGVVAGLVARGEKVVVLGSVCITDQALRPVWRKAASPTGKLRSLFIPRSSIELAFDRLLQREGMTRADVAIPAVERVGFSTLVSLLAKPASDNNAIDFAVLVEPFISNVLAEHAADYRLGPGGLYEMHYCVVVRQEDLLSNRPRFESLMRQLVAADDGLQQLIWQGTLLQNSWGRLKDGQPELLPALATFDPHAMRLTLQPSRLKVLLKEEIDYLVAKYPGELKAPNSIDALVDASVLEGIDPTRVTH